MNTLCLLIISVALIAIGSTLRDILAELRALREREETPVRTMGASNSTR